MTSGAKASDLRGEVGAEIACGDHVDLDASALEDHHSVATDTGGVTPRIARASRYCGMSGFAEDADARYDAALVSAGGQGFEEQSIRFVAAAVGRIVERILGQQNFEPRMNAVNADKAGESIGVDRRSSAAISLFSRSPLAQALQ